MIRLTDEEIRAIGEKAQVDSGGQLNFSAYTCGLMDGSKAQLKKFLEWDRGACPHPRHRNDPPLNGRKDCFKCWQSLEVKE